MKRKFTRNELLDILESDQVIVDQLSKRFRWSVQHKLIFEHEGKFYLTSYSVGATESQCERPWEYQDEIECEEVKKVIKQIENWELV